MFESAIVRLLAIGWLELISLDDNTLEEISHPPAIKSHPPAEISHPSALEQKGTEQKGTEQKGTEQKGTEQKGNENTPLPPKGGLSEITQAWNDMAKANSLATVRDLTDARRRHLQARLRDKAWAESWREAIEELADQYRLVIDRMIDAPDRPIGSFNILTSQQRNTMIRAYNATGEPYPTDVTIHRMIEEQAARTPENESVLFRERSLTYTELNARANRLAETNSRTESKTFSLRIQPQSKRLWEGSKFSPNY